jgi:hypothetical protein
MNASCGIHAQLIVGIFSAEILYRIRKIPLNCKHI